MRLWGKNVRADMVSPWKGKVAGDMARDTKIMVASINTCKNRQRGSRRINGGDANFQWPLARRFSSFTEKPCMRVLASLPPPLPKKKIPRRSKWNRARIDLTACVSLQCMASHFFFFFLDLQWPLINALLYSPRSESRLECFSDSTAREGCTLVIKQIICRIYWPALR